MRDIAWKCCLISLIAAILGVNLLSALFGQGGPISPNATVSLFSAVTTVQVNREFSVDLLINLNNATGFNSSGASTPAILGGYVFNVGFNTADFQLMGVDNGTASEFVFPLVSTTPSIANVAGYVGVTNAQTGTTPRSGAYLIAKARFKPKRPFVSSLLVVDPTSARSPMSLSSALFPGVQSAGPVLIGFNAGSNLAIKSVAQGDADANGSVNVNDVTALIQGLFNIGVRTPAMDCNWDGKYSAADVVCTVRAIFGLTTP